MLWGTYTFSFLAVVTPVPIVLDVKDVSVAFGIDGSVYPVDYDYSIMYLHT